MTVDPVPVAVVGAGNMGANHVRVFDELSTAELVGVVETDPERARTVRDAFGVEVFKEIDDLERIAAVSIAVPNRHHREVAEQCIEDGLDILVEKPLALTIEDAEAIVEAATENSSVLQTGHIEQFNPAVITLKEILQSERLIAVEAHRLGPFNEHLTQESVVFDLMIHDIDIIDSLISGTMEHLSAVGNNSRSEEIDHAVAQFKFDKGVIGSAIASHVTHGKIRTLSVTTENAFIELNYQEQDITIQRRGIEQTTTLSNKTGYRTETIMESPYIKTQEPLKVELEHFLDCVKNRDDPMVDGKDGLNAVRLATDIIRAIRTN